MNPLPREICGDPPRHDIGACCYPHCGCPVSEPTDAPPTPLDRLRAIHAGYPSSLDRDTSLDHWRLLTEALLDLYERVRAMEARRPALIVSGKVAELRAALAGDHQGAEDDA
jgi:hypothetical protein